MRQVVAIVLWDLKGFALDAVVQILQKTKENDESEGDVEVSGRTPPSVLSHPQ